MTSKTPPVKRTKEKAQEMGLQYLCLGCEKKVDPTLEQYRRGLCEACYSEVDRLKARGQVTYEELVEAGLMLPGKKGGRPRSADRRPSAFAAYLKSKGSPEMTTQPVTDPAKPGGGKGRGKGKK